MQNSGIEGAVKGTHFRVQGGAVAGESPFVWLPVIFSFFFFRAAARVVKLASIRKVRKRACTENENQNPRGPLVLSHHEPRSSCRSTN